MRSIQEQVVRFIEHTNMPLLLMGKAGTGKTTMIRQLKTELRGTVLVSAPTGVAAMQTESMTLHALFGLPLLMFLPETKKHIQSGAALDQFNYLRKVRLSREKIQLLQSLDVLIIDEISMVRADTLDAIDLVLRKIRSNPNEPFGGVQLLMVGDLFQLPPVLIRSEQALFHQYYRCTYFFAARVFRSCWPVCLELTDVWRQQDPVFIHLLHRIRLNQSTDADWLLLNSRCQKEHLAQSEQSIVLTSHVQQASRINQQNLQALPGPEISFDARISGRIPNGYFPAEATLVLKKGARILFIKNDTQKPRRFYNGKEGIVESWNEEEITIRTDEEINSIQLRRDVWKQIEYVYREQTHQIEEKEVGRFEQFPIRLAWAITIHKAQGLSFDRLHIDVQSAFASGLLYVALSRARSLEGIRLNNPLPRMTRPFPASLLHFMKLAEQQDIDSLYQTGSNTWAWLQFQSLLDGRRLQKLFWRFSQAFKKRSGILDSDWNKQLNGIETELKDWCRKATQYLHSFHPARFSEQISSVAASSRYTNACGWFKEKLEFVYANTLVVARTDLTDCFTRQEEKWLEDFIQSVQQHIQRLAQCNIVSALFGKHPNKDSFPINPAPGIDSIANVTDRLLRLQQWRQHTASECGCSIWEIASDCSLHALARLPLKEKAELDHFLISMGVQWNESIRSSFWRLHKSLNEPVQGCTKQSSRNQTLDLIQQGFSIQEIANKRKLKTQTVEGHIADLIATDQLPIYQWMDASSVQQIMEKINDNPSLRIRDIKKILPQVSYANIRMVIAHLQRQL